MKRFLRASLRQVSRAYRAVTRAKRLPLLHLSEEDFDTLAAQHEESVLRWDAALKSLLETAASRPEIFRAASLRDLPFEARDELRSSWCALLDFLQALDRVKHFHRHFPAVCPVRHPRRHARAFGLAFGAFASQFVNGLRLIRLTEKAPLVRRLLDEADPERGIPPGSFDLLKWNVLHVVDVGKLLAGDAYARPMAPLLRRRKRGPALLACIRRAVAEAKPVLKEDGARHFLDNGIAILKGKAFRTWFPIQKGIAAWMGEVRTRGDIERLIRPAQLQALARRLAPGDILVERRNWHLSNVGLPGFWPHAALHIGTPERLRESFDGEGLVERLRSRHPSKWARYLRRHKDGNPHAVIEAMGAGVLLNSFEQSAAADYVGVMRPLLPRSDIAVALERAFHYLGRPYDFDFDFLTDAELVCSELVYKCYQPGGNRKGIPFELERLAGRPVLSPNAMVAQFDRWRKQGDPPLEFVAFLDGMVRKGVALERAEPDFLLSHRRSKWDLEQY